MEPTVASAATRPQSNRPPLSPRRRRLRWTIGVLMALSVAGLAIGLFLYQRAQPKPYRPDEKLPDITSDLARNLPRAAPRPRFTDVTRQAGLAAFRTFLGPRTSQLPEDMGAGVAWGDFNNDGFEDVFLVSAGGPLNAPTQALAACELYENLGNGAFRKVADFPELRIHGMGAAWGDYDGDGYLDLVVTGYNALLLFHNEGGTGKFVRDIRLPNLPGFWSSATWGDYDNDRRLDLYVCGYVQYLENEADRNRMSAQLTTAVPYTLNPASYQPALKLLFHNNSDGTFTDVATPLGVTGPQGRSLGALWHDFDDDGWLDLYVANDLSDNVLYHNVGGKFEDISHPACVADYRSAMGLAAGDFDRDGDDDLFIGHWVGQENALYQNLATELRHPTTGSQPPSVVPATAAIRGRLAAAATPLRFTDVADLFGLGQISLAYVSWGAEFVDLDGDGWPDLVVANGSTLEEEGPRPKRLKPEEPFLFWNDHGRFFYNLAPLSPLLALPHVSRGLAVADYDNDGAMDLLVSHLGEGVQLLRNQMQTGHWLKVRLHSRLANSAPLGFGDGAKVIAHLPDVALRRTVSSVSYLSQSSHTLHFGLGQAAQVASLEVRWLGGPTNYYARLQADVTWELTEGEPAPKRFIARAAHGAAAGSANTAHESQGRISGASSPQPSPPFYGGEGDFPLPKDAVRGERRAEASPRSLPDTTTAARTGPLLPSADKGRVLEFWQHQRAGMHALKIDKNIPEAIRQFRAALALDPQHEDSQYYLGLCLSSQGDSTGALEQFAELIRLNPQSHRAFQQWGVVRAQSAASDADLAAAEAALQKAHDLNPEETGALLVLGEVSLLRGRRTEAEQRLAAACRTNAKAVGGFFLRGYLAWVSGQTNQARADLERAREALGKDWKPKGATAEGDVHAQQYAETTPLSRFWEHWDGVPDPDRAYRSLAKRLKTFQPEIQ